MSDVISKGSWVRADCHASQSTITKKAIVVQTGDTENPWILQDFETGLLIYISEPFTLMELETPVLDELTVEEDSKDSLLKMAKLIIETIGTTQAEELSTIRAASQWLLLYNRTKAVQPPSQPSGKGESEGEEQARWDREFMEGL